MGLLRLFRPFANAGYTTAQHQPAPIPVNVTAAERQRPVIDHGQGDALEFKRDPLLAAQIRNNLPNRPVSQNLRAARFAAVLSKEAAFLADASGAVEPPERWEVVDACQFAAEFIRDAIVIGVKA